MSYFLFTTVINTHPCGSGELQSTETNSPFWNSCCPVRRLWCRWLWECPSSWWCSLWEAQRKRWAVTHKLYQVTRQVSILSPPDMCPLWALAPETETFPALGSDSAHTEDKKTGRGKRDCVVRSRAKPPRTTPVCLTYELMSINWPPPQHITCPHFNSVGLALRLEGH